MTQTLQASVIIWQVSTRLTDNDNVQCESKKVAPAKKNFFCNIFTQVKYISVKFCGFVASFISTHTYQFCSIYLNI